jgi:hypothetical protein
MFGKPVRLPFFIISLILFLITGLHLRAQNLDTIYTTRVYTDIPFAVFVNEIENSSPVRFYFDPSWVDSLKTGDLPAGISIPSALKMILNKTSFTFEIYEQSKVVLLPVIHDDRNKMNGSSNGSVVIGNSSQKGRYKEAKIQGQVLEGETGTPIIGAIIYFEEAKLGTTSGKEGRYSIHVPTGKQTVRFSFIGLEEIHQPVIIYESGKLDMELFEKTVNLEEVVVKQTRKDQNVSSTSMGNIRIDAKTISKLPVLMGETDIIKSLVLLPGVTTAGEGSGGFNVRGGNSDQNLILMDEAPVYNPSHLFGLFSVINGDAVKDVILVKGDIPAKYGGRGSSLMDIAMKNGNNQQLKGTGGIGILNSKVEVDGPLQNRKGSYLFSARTTYSDWLLKKIPDVEVQNSNANFYDYSGKISLNVSENNYLSAFGYTSKDQFQLGSSSRYAYGNLLGSLKLNHIFSARFYGSVTAVYSKYENEVSDISSPFIANRMETGLSHTEFKSDYHYSLSEYHRLDGGIDFIMYGFQPGKNSPYNSQSSLVSAKLQAEHAVQSAIYISDEITLNEKVSVNVGLRYSQFCNTGPYVVYKYEPGQAMTELSIIDSTQYQRGDKIASFHGLEPRIGFRFGINGASSIKLGYNRHMQYIHMISNATAMSSTDIWKPSGKYIKPTIVDQVSAGYFHNFKENTIETSVETYIKFNHQLIEYKNGAQLYMNSHIETELLSSQGLSYGIEFLVRRNAGKLTGWGGYTYSRSRIKTMGDFPGETFWNGKYYPAYFDKPHDLTLALNYQLTRRWRFSGNFTYNTGRPVTLPERTYEYNGLELVYFSERNKYRMPDYHRLDLSISLDGNLKKYHRWKSSWTLSVYNVYGRKNTYSIFYQREYPSMANDYREYSLYKFSVFAKPFPSLSYNFSF